MKDANNEEDLHYLAFTELVRFVKFAATPKRPDGTYNYCREALEAEAKELLKRHKFV